MDANFDAMVEAYLRIGVLGLLAVVFILLVIWLIKKLMNGTMKSNEQMIDIIVNQNKQMLCSLTQNYKKDIKESVDNAVKQITSHTPSSEENEKQTKITESIDECLEHILLKLDADRTSVIQYHNGGRGLNKQSFLKMSMTNEKIQAGVQPFASMFKDQFRTVLGYFTKELNNTGKCYISNIEDIKTKDVGMYEFLSNRGIVSKYGIAVRNKENVVIGFICVEYENRKTKDVETIDKVLQENHHTIEALLNL